MSLSATLQEIHEYRGVEGLVAAEVLTDDDTSGYTTGSVFAIAGVAEISRSTDSSNEPHYYDNIPENLQYSQRAEDSETAIENMEEALDLLNELYEADVFDKDSELIEEAIEKIEDAQW